MIKFETINELTLKVTTTGNDVIFTKTDALSQATAAATLITASKSPSRTAEKSRPGSTRLPDAPRHR